MLRYEYKNYFCVALWLIVCKLNMYFFKERDLNMTLDLITIKSIFDNFWKKSLQLA